MRTRPSTDKRFYSNSQINRLLGKPKKSKAKSNVDRYQRLYGKLLKLYQMAAWKTKGELPEEETARYGKRSEEQDYDFGYESPLHSGLSQISVANF